VDTPVDTGFQKTRAARGHGLPKRARQKARLPGDGLVHQGRNFHKAKDKHFLSNSLTAR